MSIIAEEEPDDLDGQSRSRKEMAEVELSEYFKIIENGLFKKNTDCMQFWLSKAITFPMIYLLVVMKLHFSFCLFRLHLDLLNVSSHVLD